MLNVKHVRDLIIEPALIGLGMHSKAAVELVLGTGLQESNLKYLKQLGSGPALGLFQMEPRTHDDIWENWLAYKPDVVESVRQLAGRETLAREMVGNLWYAAAMCRIHYRRVPKPLPEAGDIEGMAAYWKEHYNTYLGAGTVEEYEENWREGTFML